MRVFAFDVTQKNPSFPHFGTQQVSVIMNTSHAFLRHLSLCYRDLQPPGEQLPVNNTYLNIRHHVPVNDYTSIGLSMTERKVVPGSSHRPPHNNLAQRVDFQVLGRSYDAWTVALLRTFISHYGQILPPHMSKDHLMHIMAQIVRKHGLEDSDYTDMYRAYWGRQILPACKPLANPQLPITPIDTSTRSKKCCIVCWDELAAYLTPYRSLTSECIHESNVCISCVSKSISTQLDQKPLDRITCPACDAQLQAQDIHSFGSVEAREKYEHPYILIARSHANLCQILTTLCSKMPVRTISRRGCC